MKKIDFQGWPSGDSKPVIELGFSLAEIEQRYELKFFRDRDDLDWFHVTYLDDINVGSIVFMKYENSPASGVIMYVDSLVDTKEAINKIKQLLDIDNNDILWKQSEI